MYQKVNKNSSQSIKLSTRKQRRLLLKSKARNKVRAKRKILGLSRSNRQRHNNKKAMDGNKGSITADIFEGYESTDAENNSEPDECILMESKQTTIVIEDDDDLSVKSSRLNNVGSETDDVICIDSQMSENEFDSLEPKPSNLIKPESTESTNVSPKKSVINQEHASLLSPSSKTPSVFGDSALFYNDTTPTYGIIEPDDSIIFVDNISQAADKKTNVENIDDSVIFVGEEIVLNNYNPTQKALDYIPLSSNTNRENIPSLKRQRDGLLDDFIHSVKKSKNQLNFIYQNTSTPKEKSICGQKSNKSLLTRTEKHTNEVYNSNIYNPSKEVEKKTGKRMVIIDGSNVAFGHSLNKEFSVKGLAICIEYFMKKGHEVKAVVPQFRLQKSKSSEPEKLEKMHKEGKIVFTPCKNLPGKSAISYDDRFILQLAVEFDAAVVSNDNYRDLMTENPAFKKIIENRVIGYTWCKDMFLLPKDPYGRLGPTLSIILNH